MRFTHAAHAVLGVPFAALALCGLAACTPNLDDKLACHDSTQCPTGYFCASDGKCQQGDTSPEITVITPTSGITFSGVISLQMSVIDPVGISSVTVGLAGPGADAGTPVAATAGQNSVYTATLDTRALGISASGGFTATITATNTKGKVTTATVQLQLDDQAPLVTNVLIQPPTIAAGQAATISFDAGEALTALPVVKVTPPDNSGARHAAYVSIADHTYTYQFIPLPTDPLGVWHVQITAQDSFGNTATTPGSDTLTVVAGGAQSVTFTGVRGDGVSDARAFSLKAAATLNVTAQFGAPLSAAPTAFLCPVATPGPCTASSGGTALTVTAGSAANSYSIAVPAVVGVSGNPNEGNHVLSVSGSSASGSAISGSVNVVYDFTAPTFQVQSLDNNSEQDDNGNTLVSLAKSATLGYVAILNEALPTLPAPVATLDGTIPVALDPHPTSALLPQFLVTLGGALASIPPTLVPHTLQVTLCDAANNCATNSSDPFIEVDTSAKIKFDYPNELSGLQADGGPEVFTAGKTVTVGLDFDRQLSSDLSSSIVQVELVNANDSSDIISFENPPSGYTPTDTSVPFGYYFSTEIPSDAVDGAYKIQLSYGYDAYGNYLSTTFANHPSTPVVQSAPPYVMVKTSTPQLNYANAVGGTTTQPQLAVNGPVTTWFTSQSNGTYDDLMQGTLAVCINPDVSKNGLNCPSGSGTTASANGLNASVNVTSGNVGAVNNAVGALSLSVSGSSANNGGQFVLVTFTDAAGNVGAIPFSPVIDTKAPTLAQWSLSATQVPPKGSATFTVTFNDQSSINPSSVAGLVAAGGPTTVLVVPPVLQPNGSYQITFTMPAKCDGLSGDPSATPFVLGVTAVDSAGNGYNSISAGLSPPPTLACIPAPHVTNWQFDKTIVPAGGTATATVTVDEALGNISGGTVTGNANPLTGVTATTTNASSTPRVFNVAYKMSALCNGSPGNPTDGVPFPVYVTLFDGANTTAPIQLGTLTCTATSVANATPVPQNIYLFKQPFPDGSLRTTVLAAAGALTGFSGSGAGVTLVASTIVNSVTTVVGSGPLLPDGSVGEFQLSSPKTQVTLTFTDLVGNTKVVQPGQYAEQLLINGLGTYGVSSSQNPFQLFDVGTGDDTFYPASYWVAGGTGPDGGPAGPVLDRPQADAGYSAGLALAELSNIDNSTLTVNSAPPFVLDAGTNARMTFLGTESFGNPLFAYGDAGTPVPVNAQTPPPRTNGSAMEFINSQLYLVGGFNAGNTVDPVGTYWTWQRDSGWSKNSVTFFDGGSPANSSVALGTDYTGDLLVFGGSTNQVTGLYTTYLQDGGVSIWWGSAGAIGTPAGDGGVTAAVSPQIFSSTVVQAGAPVTILNSSLSGIDNCLAFIPGYPYGVYGGPAGSQVYSCATSGGLGGSFHQFAALASGYTATPSGVSYNLFSFGGKTIGGTSASTDLLASNVSYSYSFSPPASGTATFSANWTTLVPNASSPIPPARYAASLYVVSPTKIGMYGGVNGSGGMFNDSWEFDLVTNMWTPIDNQHVNAIMAPARAFPASASYNGNLYIFGGNNGLSDGWTLGRESRNRYIAKLPIASQLTSPGTATLGQLSITVANPSSGSGNVVGGMRPLFTQPDMTMWDSASRYDLYFWTGTTWTFATNLGPVESFSIPASAFPSITSGDGNIYVMVAGAPTATDGIQPYPISLDALTFTLNFQ